MNNYSEMKQDMNAPLPRISVIMITYNQEKLIGRAIDSLLSQKEFLYEICISDDCSTDSTWQVIKGYKDRFPSLFNIHKNEKNLGIFENVEQSWTMPTGDIVYQLAGDDMCGENWFKKVTDFIIENQIDCKKELFCIYGDYKIVYPTGDSIVIKNKYADSKTDHLRLYERGLLFNRSSCYSINVLKRFVRVSDGRSYKVENAQDSQVHIFSKVHYYISSIGNIYFSDIGEGSRAVSEERQKEYEQTMPYAFNFFENLGIHLPTVDMHLPAKNIAKKRFLNHKSFANLLSWLYTSLRSFDIKIGVGKSGIIKLFLFRIVRRLPHRSPIHW